MIRQVKSEVFLKSPAKGTGVSGFAHYTKKEGLSLMSVHSLITRSDTLDTAYYRFSEDNGKTWSEPVEMATGRRTGKGMLRRYIQPGFIDPQTGRLIFFIKQAVLPDDNPVEGVKHWTLRYAISPDGGRTLSNERLLIQKGDAYNESHPMEGVYTGKNGVMLGDHTEQPICTKSGEILLPVQINPLGPDGEYYNAGGGYTYHYSAVLIGTWDNNGLLAWNMSSPVMGDAERTTRGVFEPTIIQVPDGRILMVMRGSNDVKPELPGRRWYSVSKDGGRTWSEPEPWKYTNGEAFYSPSSCSQLLTHSSGKFFWIGNISENNTKGNLPRYPLVIAEVDSSSLLLKKDTISVIDTLRKGDNLKLTLSNFYAHEDRVTGEIVVYCPPFFRTGDWTADLFEYRIEVDFTRT